MELDPLPRRIALRGLDLAIAELLECPQDIGAQRGLAQADATLRLVLKRETLGLFGTDS